MHRHAGLVVAAAVILLASGPNPAESARVFTIVNFCKTTVWPAVTPGADIDDGGGFPLKPGQSAAFTAPDGWPGRIWARTGCSFDDSGHGSCQTGACGTTLKCGAASGTPPASLAQFYLGTVDVYDVSLVDGFNLPVVVRPVDGHGNCTTVGCDSDLLPRCPPDLQLLAGQTVVGCRSACDVYNTDEYCCRRTYGNPTTCQPTNYSRTFKEACPTAYSYAFDEPTTSAFTCSGANYIVYFCSSRRQRECTDKNNRLVCSGTGGWRRPSRRQLAATALFSATLLWATG